MDDKDSLYNDEHKKGEVISGNKITLCIGGKVVGTATSDDYETNQIHTTLPSKSTL